MYNRELQFIDTQEKAYLLGLFYSDGNIGVNQNQCRIELKLEDKELIFNLQKLFPFFYIHYDRGTKIELGNYSKKLKEDLVLNGCLPRKSFENKNNLHIPITNSSIIRHFIRGYFDGDGGCSLSVSKGKIQKRVYIYSVSIPFLNEIKDVLSLNNILSRVNIYNEIGKLEINASSYAKFYSFLYDDSTISMDRKKSKYEEILRTSFFVQKVTPVCKFCSSNNTVCDGYDYYKAKKQRYLCKECKRHFTAPQSSNTLSGGDELLEA